MDDSSSASSVPSLSFGETRAESGEHQNIHSSVAEPCAQLHTSVESNKAFAGFQAVSENLELLVELLTLRPDFLRLPGKARHLVVGHVKNQSRGQNALQRGRQLGFNHFDGHIVDESLEGNLPSGWN